MKHEVGDWLICEKSSIYVGTKGADVGDIIYIINNGPSDHWDVEVKHTADDNNLCGEYYLRIEYVKKHFRKLTNKEILIYRLKYNI